MNLNMHLQRGISRLRSSGGAGAIFDQCIVSGANFATVVLLYRYAGEAELGTYALAFSLMVLLIGAQNSLILVPYTVFVPRESDDQRAAFAGSTLCQSTLFSLLLAVALMGYYFLLVAQDSSYQNVIGVLSCAIPMILLRDFARRFAFANLRFDRAAIVDSVAAGLRLAALGWLAWRDELTGARALIALGSADGVAACMWWITSRRQFGFTPGRWKRDARENWRFGRWGVLSQSVFVAQNYSVHWILAAFCGSEAIGVYSMCTTIVQLAGPLMQGAGNFITPLVSKSFAKDTIQGLSRTVRLCTYVVAPTALAYLLFMMLFSGSLLKLIYGSNMMPYTNVLIVLALGTTCAAIGLPPSKAISVLERPNYNFMINLLALLLAASVGFVFAPSGNLLGAASGVAAGFVVASVLRWIAYLRLRRSVVNG